MATKTSVRPAALAQNQRERDPVTKKKTKKKGTPKKNSVNGQFRARIDAKSGPSRWKKFFFVAEKFRCTVVYFFLVMSTRIDFGRDAIQVQWETVDPFLHGNSCWWLVGGGALYERPYGTGKNTWH